MCATKGATVRVKCAQSTAARVRAWVSGRLLDHAAVLTAMSGLLVSVSAAPPVIADPVNSLRAAIMQARGAACGPLRSDPLVEKAADALNRSVDGWAGLTSPIPPMDDAKPIMKDLGYRGDKVAMARGAAKVETDAIKGVLLEGHAVIPDCAYKDYGVSVIQDSKIERQFLVLLVVAGP